MTRHFRSTALGAGVLGAALAVSACSLPNQTATEAAAEIAEPLSSGEILETMRAINYGEIAQARLALTKSTNPQVRETARLIIADHTASNERIKALAQAINADFEDSALSEGIEEQAEAIRGELAELSEQDFNRQYLQKQVELHQVALDTVSTELLPDADNAQLRQLLEQAYAPNLEQHLNAAEQNYAQLTDRPSS